MDLSKAFDCIPPDLIIAKLEAYGFGDAALEIIFFYLKNRKQWVGISNVYSNFEHIISGVPPVGTLTTCFSSSTSIWLLN